jgi:hypothetical protein
MSTKEATEIRYLRLDYWDYRKIYDYTGIEVSNAVYAKTEELIENIIRDVQRLVENEVDSVFP